MTPPATAPSLLVVAENDVTWQTIRRACANQPWRLILCPSWAEAPAAIESLGRNLDLLVIETHLPGSCATALLDSTHYTDPSLPIIMVTPHGTPRAAVASIRAGAFDYISQPVDEEDLVIRLAVAIERRELMRKRPQAAVDEEVEQYMGPSRAVSELARLVGQVGTSELSVLIEGESGTGKEFLARRLHALSPRRRGPFIAVDCGAIPETLIESKCFGYKKGSFTGADADRGGFFQAAHGGTLFLDEIGNLPLGHQPRLLRALERREVLPVGATSPVPVDVRVISATNLSLTGRVLPKAFREDLFHRLAEFPIRIPPLRERPEDILFLAHKFLEDACREMDKPLTSFSPIAQQQLAMYDWPGNVRELRSAVRRAVVVSSGVIASIPIGTSQPDGPIGGVTRVAANDAIIIHARAVINLRNLDLDMIPLKKTVSEVTHKIEREIIAAVLQKVNGNKSHAARLLDIDYKTIYSKVKMYGLEKDVVA
ncbi:MAG: sigma-54-dependent Fis family transcriptional regulator [Candidatus Schekmanbacteria bacterium]|nr:sigma-54-dependent Fis family transcriptional regulator [Candidatus Schekmanbacteria bacterium]